MNIVSFLPVERLDDLVKATGFDLEGIDYEYKYRWLLERIALLKDQARQVAIVRDNDDIRKLVAEIQSERQWSHGLEGTIQALQAELEKYRRKDPHA